MTKKRIALTDSALRKVSENGLYAAEGAFARKYSILVKLTMYEYSPAAEFCINIHFPSPAVPYAGELLPERCRQTAVRWNYGTKKDALCRP